VDDENEDDDSTEEEDDEEGLESGSASKGDIDSLDETLEDDRDDENRGNGAEDETEEGETGRRVCSTGAVVELASPEFCIMAFESARFERGSGIS